TTKPINLCYARRKIMTDNKTTHWKKQGQRGVALLMALMVLLLLTALAAALVFVSNTETSVNANYRRQQVLYFASKAGIEEAWYSTNARNIPCNATAAALPYQWVRITPKLNGSVQGYKVNAAAPATTQICWDGTEEILLSGAANCTQMVNATPPGPAANPVYL